MTDRSAGAQRRRRLSAHACPACGRPWALRAEREASGVWLIRCFHCQWRDVRGGPTEIRSSLPVHNGAGGPGRMHGVQFYVDDDHLISELSDFLADGWAAGGSAIVIATPAHRSALRDRMAGRALSRMTSDGRFVELDAVNTLRQFMRDGSPDPELFAQTVGSLVREHAVDAPLRAFGEMVDVLWGAGNILGALALEKLWRRLQGDVAFALQCGYDCAHVDPLGRALLMRAHDHVAA